MITILGLDETVDECEMCHKETELRPYGPDGAWVCFDCAMKDEPNAIKQFQKRLNTEHADKSRMEH